jgi:hypothetical protein
VARCVSAGRGHSTTDMTCTCSKSEYETTEITIRVLADGDPLPTTEAYSAAATTNGEAKQTTIATYASRQSKRLRTGTSKRREHRLTIRKSTTVKALKLQVPSPVPFFLSVYSPIASRAQIQDELQIPTICQRLFRAGDELLENSVALGALGVLARDVLDLREEREDVDLLDTDDAAPRARDEGRGFGGTLLGGDFAPSDAESRSASERPSSPVEPDLKQCHTCTLLNPHTALSCSVCESPFT